jgi:GT2 family glycosyltransferase
LYGSHDVVEGFFDSLASQRDVDFKLYVIDNSPSSETLELCRRLASHYHIDAEFVFNNANVGVARGNNQGIELALRDGCAAVLLANNDTEFDTGTIRLLIEEWRGGAMAATPKLLYHGAERLIWFAGGGINSWTMRTPHYGQLEVDHGQYDTPGETGYAPTCFLLVDATVFMRVGSMDETYFVYYDDTDFVWRMLQAGVRIRYVPNAVVHHKVSTSTGGAESPFTIYYSNRNRIYFIRKNLFGLRRMVAMAYALATRLVRTARLPLRLSARMWAGVHDGMKLPVSLHNLSGP